MHKSIQLNFDGAGLGLTDAEVKQFLIDGLKYLGEKARNKNAGEAMRRMADAAQATRVYEYDPRWGEPVFYVP